MLHACALLSYWTGLFTPEVQDEVVLAIAHGLLAQQDRGPVAGSLLAVQGDQIDDEDEP
jgi:hypothetical protein